MRLIFRAEIKHPLFAHLPIAHAIEEKGLCTALAGTYHELMQAAARGARARRAIFVLHFNESAFLTDEEREELWQAYEVPVFAILRDPDGSLLAYECEAQAGLHVTARRYFSENRLETSPCECGRPGDRVFIGAQSQTEAERERSAAARPSPVLCP